MNRRSALTLTLAAVLAGCSGWGDSKLNPSNWFGGSRSGPGTTLEPNQVEDGRFLVREIVEMSVSPTMAGAIVSAKALPPTQGYWQAELIPTNYGEPDDKGVMTYSFIVYPPLRQEPVSTPQSRWVTAAIFLSHHDLAEIRTIVVQGELNSRSSRR